MVSFIHKNKDTFVEGVRVERERIIALLEMQLETIRDSRLNGIVVLSSAIALVRGGNE